MATMEVGNFKSALKDLKKGIDEIIRDLNYYPDDNYVLTDVYFSQFERKLEKLLMGVDLMYVES